MASVEPNQLFDWRQDEYSDHGEDYEEMSNRQNPIPDSLKPHINIKIPNQDADRNSNVLDSADKSDGNLLEGKDEQKSGRSNSHNLSPDKLKDEDRLMNSEEIFTDGEESVGSAGKSADLRDDAGRVRGDADPDTQILVEGHEEEQGSEDKGEVGKPDGISAKLEASQEKSEDLEASETEEEVEDMPALFKLLEEEEISWIELFYLIDSKKTGSITGMALYLDLVREMGCTKPLAYQILKEIDLDLDAFITVNEWISYESKLPKAFQQNSVHRGADIIQKLLVQLKANDMKILEVFNEASQYANEAQLSTIVLMRFLTDTLHLSKQNAKTILQEVDLDQDGFITNKEWIEYMNKKLDQSETHQFNQILSKDDLYKPLKDEIKNMYNKSLISKLNSGGVQLSGLVEYAHNSAQTNISSKPKLVANLEDLVKANAQTPEISPNQKRRSLLTDSRMEKSDRESKLSVSEVDGKKEGAMTQEEKREEFRKWAREIQWNQEFEFTSVLCKQFLNGQSFFSQKEIYAELRKIDTDMDGLLTKDEWFDYFDKRDLHKYERTPVPAEIHAKEAKMYRRLMNTLVSRRLNIFKVFQEKAEGRMYLYISQLGAALLEHLPIELEEVIYFGLSHACRSRTGFITYPELKRMFVGLCEVFKEVYSEPSPMARDYEAALLEIKGLSVIISSFRFLIYTNYLEKLEELTKVIGGEQLASWNQLYHYLRPLIIEKKNAVVNLDKNSVLTVIKLMDGNSDGFMHKWVWDYTMHSSYDDYFYSLLDVSVFKSNVEREVLKCEEALESVNGTSARIRALESCLEKKGLTSLEEGFIVDTIFIT
jgi:Ca2+-binding EF-hand superfamily protein